MSRPIHIIFITVLSILVISVLIYLSFYGYAYYITDIKDRFFHTDYENLKPSGFWGHGLGIIGTFLIIIGVVSYILRKKWRKISRWGLLKHWLEFHIFLCTLGPILILFHTSFKFGGLVAISFWSMVAVFLSGVIGRFIYIQIPRSIEGRELSLNEVNQMKKDLETILINEYNLSEENAHLIIENTQKTDDTIHKNLLKRVYYSRLNDLNILKSIKKYLKSNNIDKSRRKKIIRLIKDELVLNHRINRLIFMQKIFKYWHVAHLPFAFVMLIIVIIHIIVTLLLGYKWVF